MNWIIGTLLVLFAVAGGGLAWWKGTRDLASPPGRYDRPIGVGRREYERQLQLRYRRRRILLTVAGIVGGAVGGFAFLLVAAIRHWFR
ncbi:hypothetical protein [Reyranella soli]|jgi:hypothetical protein|uniref:Uncharacterized protein n=1 Tax=Reyranella soli TaxID=1230389 RepID=A0A512NI17_9HYPH|nr:hypothetical protein [Reyranella soli]GEP58562.1 hypothetical protein RSO01_57280 [Reyranella soli]